MNIFKQKWVKILAWVLFIISILMLILTGITQEQVSGSLVVIFTAISAVSAVIAMIEQYLNKKE